MAASTLRRAAETGEPAQPVRNILGSSTDIDAAYAVQRANHEHALEQGRRVSGRKIGLTTKAVQKQLGVDQPDYGVLYSDMCLADGQTLDTKSLLAPRVEGEVAIVLKHDLDDGNHNVIDIINATAYILPAIEIVDSRVGWDLTIVDTVADNASCGFYVVGSQPVGLSEIDVRRIPMSLSVNGKQRSTGIGSACLGNPLHAATWVANTMAARGNPLRAGECILTGALGPMVDIGAGDEITADFGPLGTVCTSISDSL